MADSALPTRSSKNTVNAKSASSKPESLPSKSKKSSSAKTAARTKESEKVPSAKSTKTKSKRGDSITEDVVVESSLQNAGGKGKDKTSVLSQPLAADVALAKQAKEVKKDKRFANLTPDAKQAKRREERLKRKQALEEINVSTTAVKPVTDDGQTIPDTIDKEVITTTAKSRPEKPSIRAKREKEKLSKAKEWRVSQPIGGRYSTNNLVYSLDEKYIFLSQGPSLKIFSTKTSLLFRTLQHLRPPPSNFPYTPSGNYSSIANYTLDPANPNQVYTITFNGEILLWDWVEGTIEGFWKTDLHQSQYLAWCGLRVFPDAADSKTTTLWTYHEYGIRDFTRKTQREIRSFDIPKTPDPKNTNLTSQTILTIENSRPRHLVIVDASTFVVDSGESFYVGNKQKQIQETVSEWRVRKISAPNKILTIDAIARYKKTGSTIQGDVAVGDNTGQIFIYHDILNPFGPTAAQNVVKSKLHWHRTGVGSIKYSKDGTYLISGGKETVLVLWQLTTSHQQHLPNLGAGIKLITLSPSGSEYALILADNSCLTISTTELKPKTSISGIQSRVFLREEYHKIYEKGGKISKKLSRKQADMSLSWRIPCVKNPWNKMQILLAAPVSQKGESSYPYLQTFDLSQDRGVGKQAITRTMVSMKNVNPEGGKLKEPNVKFLSISGDGTWLASVDEWAAPARDFVDPGAPQPPFEATVAKEVILRFWRWATEDGKGRWELVSMIESPHGVLPNGSAGEVADLTGSPKSNMFASVGGDGTIKIWGSRARTRAGVTVEKDGMVVWNCRRNLELFKSSPNAIQDGRIAYSADGSIVAVSYSDGEDGVVTIIDPITGTVQQEISSLQTSTIFAIEFIDKYLIIAGAQRVVIWNLVTGVAQWGSELKPLVSSRVKLHANNFVPNIHLAANAANGTFAIAVNFPLFSENQKRIKKLDDLTKAGNTASMVSVFKLDSEKGDGGFEIVCRTKAVNGVLALGATGGEAVGGGNGYFWLDGAANVYFLSSGGVVGGGGVTEKGNVYLEDVDGIGGLANAFLEKAVIQDEEDVNGMDDAEGDGKVVRSHMLARLFPAPAYASPAVGDVFGRFMEIVSEKALDAERPAVRGQELKGRGEVEMAIDFEVHRYSDDEDEEEDSREDDEEEEGDVSMRDLERSVFADLPDRKFDVIIDQVEH
ncbi:hypothetical protein ABW19_dt0205841 [Dactylella cylindrospora]|nr:hypothetical protein ABW19_dt0205841 [Dactylella cylindrospora]